MDCPPFSGNVFDVYDEKNLKRLSPFLLRYLLAWIQKVQHKVTQRLAGREFYLALALSSPMYSTYL